MNWLLLFRPSFTFIRVLGIVFPITAHPECSRRNIDPLEIQITNIVNPSIVIAFFRTTCEKYIAQKDQAYQKHDAHSFIVRFIHNFTVYSDIL